MRRPTVAVDPEMATEVVENPRILLTAASEAVPGWSARFGGPEGVAYLASLVQESLAADMRDVAALRSAAISVMLRGQSLAAVGEKLGVSRQAVYRAHAAYTVSTTPRTYADLATKEERW